MVESLRNHPAASPPIDRFRFVQPILLSLILRCPRDPPAEARSIYTMRRAGTTARPDRGADQLVTDGPFSFSRHPLYLAGTLLILGIGLVSGVVWFLLLAILAAFAVQKVAIEREERHLQARFGTRYVEYAKRVRRWI
jgi:protein-S-isoprenylcysteine O-methyltransferase Ste14